MVRSKSRSGTSNVYNYRYYNKMPFRAMRNLLIKVAVDDLWQGPGDYLLTFEGGQQKYVKIPPNGSVADFERKLIVNDNPDMGHGSITRVDRKSSGLDLNG